MTRKPYPTDLSDAEWSWLQPLIPPPKPGGRPRTTNLREVLNALFYVLRGGIPWRMLPHEFPAWQTAYYYFRQWQKTGLWEQMNTLLREECRRRQGHQATPSAAIVDSQSVKTTEKGGLEATMEASRSRDASGRFW